MVFFGFLYWQATSYLNSSVEHWIQRDSTVYLTSPGEIVQRLQTHALREKSWRVAFLRLRDPDARGRPRPRAPSAAPAAA